MSLRQALACLIFALLAAPCAAQAALQPPTAEELYRLAQAAISRRAWSEAEHYLARMLALRQSDREIHSLLGMVRAEQRDFAGAAAAFAAALRFAPGSRETRYNLALARAQGRAGCGLRRGTPSNSPKRD